MVVLKHWPLVPLDVKNAFLHGGTFEKVYMDMLPGYKPCATFKGKENVETNSGWSFLAYMACATITGA